MIDIDDLADGKLTIKEGVPRTPPQEKTPPYKVSAVAKSIEEKRAELEILRLDKEIERLNKPDTNIDYYGKMLEIQAKQGEIVLQQQKQFAEQQLAQQSKMFEVQLELERIKLGDGGGDGMLESFLDVLKPLLPSVLAGMNKTPANPQNAPIMANNEKLKGGKTAPMNKKAKEEYLRRIQNNTISLQMAYEDFQKEAPQHAKVVTLEMFADFYNKLKNGDKETIKTFMKAQTS